MSRQYKTGLIITGDASGGIRAIQATDQELGKLNQGFDRGRRHQRGYADQSRATGQALDQLRRLAAPVGAALAGMFAGRALQQQIDFGDQLHKTNLRIGASTEALSQYNYVAQLSGVQFSQLTTAWQRQTRRIAEAAKGTGEASAALETLNLNAGELARLSPEDQFERIAEAMNGVAGEAQRVALAQKIWDSEGVALLQVVNQGTDAIRAMREEADRLGLTINQATAESMAGLNDEMARLQAVATGVSRQVLAELVPAMTGALQSTSALIDRLGGAEQIFEAVRVGATGLAAVLAGRYVGAFAASTAAKLAATRQAVLYQAALARMAGVSATAAGAQTALAAATRGAAGALALVGGPVGAAVIAAGAIYYFREELGLVQPEIRASAERVAELTGSLDALSQAAVRTRISQLTADLAELKTEFLEITEIGTSNDPGRIRGSGVLGVAAGEVGRQAAAIRDSVDGLVEGLYSAETEAEIKAFEAAIAGLEGHLEKLERTAITVPPVIGENDKANKEAKKAAEQHANALEALRREFDPLRAEHARYAERLEVLNRARADGAVGAEEYGEVVRWAAEQYVRAATGAEELEKAQQRLIERYDRHHLRATQLRTDLAAINVMYREGVIDGDEYARMVAEIRDEMERLAFDADPMAQEMARAWEEASKRIDETFADAFRGAFDSFDDFADQLLDGFKRLLAELAYQATLRPIVVGFTSDLGGMMGIPGMGGQGGGFGQTLAAARGLGSSAGNILGLGGSAAGAAGTAATGYAGAGWASSVATGGYTGWAGSAAAGSAAAGGGLASTIGAAMPWIGGAMLLDSLTGGKIIGGIAKGLFGGSWKTKDAGLSLGVDGGVVSGKQWEKQRRSGGLFRRSRSRTRTSALDGDIASGLQQAYSESLDALGSTLDALGQQASQLQAFSTGMTQISTKGKSEQEIQQALEDWLNDTLVSASLSVADARQYSRAGEDNVETLERLAVSLTSVNPLLEQLHDVTLDASLAGGDAASHFIALAGGFEAFADRANYYYQNILTEEERHQKAMDDAARAMGRFTARTGEVVTSTEALRDLVDGIDLTTEAGRRLYNEAMNLAPALVEVEAGMDRVRGQFNQMLADAESAIGDAESQLRRAWQTFDQQSFGQRITLLEMLGESEQALALQRERELLSIDPLLRETQQHIWALEDEAEAQKQAARATEEHRRALENARSQLGGFFTSISQWVDQQRATGGSPTGNLAESGQQFESMLSQAQAGDRNALQSITQYADRYLSAAEAMFASGGGFQQIERDVLAALEKLPDAVSAEEFLAAEITAALAQQTTDFDDIIKLSLADEIERAIFASQYTLSALVDFAANTDQLPQDLRTILGEQAHRLDSTISYLIGAYELDDELRALALNTSNNLVSTIDLVRRADLTADDRRLALEGSNRFTSVIDLALGEDLTPENRRLALLAGNAYSVTTDLILGSDLSAADRTLALESGHTYATAVELALRKDISADSRTLALAGGNVYRSLIEYAVRADVSADDRRLALESSNRYATQLDYYLRRDVSADDRTLALRHNNAYASTIDLILGKNISAENRKLALEASNTLNATVNAALGDVNDAARSLGLKSANYIQATIGAVIGSGVTPDERKLALQNANRLTTTVNAVLASGVSDDELGLALNASNAISTTITASIAKSVNANQRKLALDNANRIQTTIAASIANGVDAQTRKLALDSANRIQTTVAGLLASNVPDDVKTLALKQANSFTTTLHASLADGRLSADERRVLDARSEQIVKTLMTGGNLELTPDEWAVINAASGQKRLDLLADVAFSQADLDELGDIAGNTEATDKNTKSMEKRARDQLSKLVELSQEMGRTTDQFVSLNSTMTGLTESINALGVARREIARIERERAAREKAERERIERERKIAARRQELESRAADARSRGDKFYTAAQDTVLAKVGASGNLPQRRVNNLTGVVQRFMGSDNIMSQAELERALDHIQGQEQWSARDRAFATRLARGARQESVYHQLMGQSASLAGESYGGSVDLSFLGAQQYLNTLSNTERANLYLERYPDLSKDQARRYGKTYGPEWANYHYNRWGKREGRLFAKGGMFTNGIVTEPTGFNMGLMGEAGPEAIMPLTRHGDGSLGVRAELPALPPLLGQGDVVEVLRDLKRENQKLRQDLNRVLGNIEQHGAASVQVQQAGFQRQIAEQRRGNEYLADGAAATRLEASR